MSALFQFKKCIKTMTLLLFLGNKLLIFVFLSSLNMSALNKNKKHWGKKRLWKILCSLFPQRENSPFHTDCCVWLFHLVMHYIDEPQL